MKLTCKGEDLREAATWAARIAPSNPAAPIMAGVRLTAGDELSLAVSDWETFGTARCPAVTQDEGFTIVSARALAAIVKLDPFKSGADVSLELDNAKLVIKCGRATWKLPQLANVEEWPQWPQPGEPLGSVDGRPLGVALARVAIAADVEGKTGKDELRGVLFEFGTEQITLSATNRYRCARLPVDWTAGGDGAPGQVIVPAEVLRDVGVDGEVTISSDGSVLGLTTRRFSVLSRLMAGRFPDVSPLLRAPVESAATVVVVDTASLRSAVASASVDLPSDFGALAMEFTPDGVLVSKSSDGEDAADDYADVVSLSGEPCTVHANARYIREAIGALNGGCAMFTFPSNPRMPFLIQPCVQSDDDDPTDTADPYRHLIAPVDPSKAKA